MGESRVQAILNELSTCSVIDTHEHLMWSEKERCAGQTDVLCEYLIHYLRSDVVSAGLSMDDLATVTDTRRDIAERFAIVQPYWEACRQTGYARALDISARAIYGIDGVRQETIVALNDAFQGARQEGHYQRVLRDLCHIETSLVDCGPFRREAGSAYFRDEESPFFTAVWQPIEFIMPGQEEGPTMLDRIARNHGIEVESLEDWLNAMELELDYNLGANGVRVLKLAIAYRRSLRFEKVKTVEARELFGKAMKKRKERDGQLIFSRKLQDYMMHALMAMADERRVTVQFHTGLLEGNGNVLTNSDPALLTPLFLEYKHVRFDLFHIGYPYQGTVSALAKMFPNVYVDMCWAHMISPSACVTALDDFLDAVPANKISAFGGDYAFVDGIYGHLRMARENVSRTLDQRISRGVLTETRAVELGKMLFYDNPKRIFRLGDMPS